MDREALQPTSTSTGTGTPMGRRVEFMPKCRFGVGADTERIRQATVPGTGTRTVVPGICH